MGPEWGIMTFPTSQGSHRWPSFASPPPCPPSPTPQKRCQPHTNNISAKSKSEVDSEAESFHDIPELGDFNLSGAGIALSKQKTSACTIRPSTVSVATRNRHGD
ncbi:hypothetical protein ACOMHN_011261 [Nucella lapillus]